jgi:cytochrome c biogenesis protein CcmG, thiol:disulfide interchange protein DsbE
MKIKIKSLLIFIIPAFILVIFFLALGENKVYDTKNLTGKKISDFKLIGLDEKKNITENDLTNNNYTLINLWASWCSPCRLEHKYLMTLKKDYNLKILGINFKDNTKNATKYLKESGNPYYFVAKDVDGKTSIQFGTYGIPESILINKKLIIIKKYIGPINDKSLNEIIKVIKK